MNKRTINEIHSRGYWVFDMDGTLTHAVHDFDDIRRRLNLVQGKPILEAIAELPPDEAARAHERLFEIELELALGAVEQPGAREFLAYLRDRGRGLGLLTRNSEELAHITLRSCGLDEFFEPACVVGRERCPPKPDPAGVLLLRDLWQTSAEDMVMIGDYLFDLQAGRGAGTMTVHFNSRDLTTWPEHSDLTIADFMELLDRFSRAADHARDPAVSTTVDGEHAGKGDC
jgi:HAD superfamily hydrolase (TIGR01509 family)